MEHLLQFIGRLHPLLVHLPIGILMLTVGLHALSWSKKFEQFKPMLPLLWFVSCISAVFASLAGYVLSLEGDFSGAALDTHMWLGIALSLFSGVVFVLLKRGITAKVQMAGVAVVALLLFATGHYGGNLTHGEDYLTQPLLAFAGKTPPAPVNIPPAPIANVKEALIYKDLVRPILQEKCYNCHGTNKQKGKLRLDSEVFILKGGKHGEVLVAGQPEKSDLYALLVLPEEDERRMPPKDKKQLTAQEIKIIQWWIGQASADFQKKVAQVEADEEMKTILASLAAKPNGKAGMITEAQPEIPQSKGNRPNQAHLQELQKLGVAITFLTPDQSYLSANLVNAPSFSDAQVKALLNLQDHLLWLDLSGTQVTDKGMAQISQLKNLTRLNLDNTQVTDAGVAQLGKLSALRNLNLYNTSVTDQSLKALVSCSNLRTVHLWQTKVTPQGVAALQKARGEELEVNFEGHTQNTVL
ncbi:MAG: c-type cytochrome domain-containing protein [Rufibacter sp.]